MTTFRPPHRPGRRRRALLTAWTLAAVCAGGLSSASPAHAGSDAAAAATTSPAAAGQVAAAAQALRTRTAPVAQSPAADLRQPSVGKLSTSRAVTYGRVVAKPAKTVPFALPLLHYAAGKSEADGLCTSTAVSAWVIITAAHCVNGPGYYYVVVGANRISQGELVPVEAVSVNSRYRGTTFVHDIAVLRPLLPVRLASYARLGTPSLAARIRAGGGPALKVFGWGDDEYGDLDGRLRSAPQRQLNAVARRTYLYFNASKQIAAGNLKKRSRYQTVCDGDSGGPLTAQVGRHTYVVGVTSFSARVSCTKAPGVYTSIGSYSTWLRSAKKTLPRLARTKNRALPVALKAPSTQGSFALGQTVTCLPGRFTGNAREVKATWYRNDAPLPSSAVAGGVTHVVDVADAGASLSCRVVASSRAGSVELVTAKVPLPLQPEVVAPAVSAPAEGTPFGAGVLSCAAGTYMRAGVAVIGYAWFTSATLEPAAKVADGQQLALTGEVLSRLGGQATLHCSVYARNSMGTSVSVSAGLPLRAPAAVVTATSAPGQPREGRLDQGAELTCKTAVTPAAGAMVTYRWARSTSYESGADKPFPSGLSVIAGQTTGKYVPGPADAGQHLACEATVSSWQGAVVVHDATRATVR